MIHAKTIFTGTLGDAMKINLIFILTASMLLFCDKTHSMDLYKYTKKDLNALAIKLNINISDYEISRNSDGTILFIVPVFDNSNIIAIKDRVTIINKTANIVAIDNEGNIVASANDLKEGLNISNVGLVDTSKYDSIGFDSSGKYMFANINNNVELYRLSNIIKPLLSIKGYGHKLYVKDNKAYLFVYDIQGNQEAKRIRGTKLYFINLGDNKTIIRNSYNFDGDKLLVYDMDPENAKFVAKIEYDEPYKIFEKTFEYAISSSTKKNIKSTYKEILYLKSDIVNRFINRALIK